MASGHLQLIVIIQATVLVAAAVWLVYLWSVIANLRRQNADQRRYIQKQGTIIKALSAVKDRRSETPGSFLREVPSKREA